MRCHSVDFCCSPKQEVNILGVCLRPHTPNQWRFNSLLNPHLTNEHDVALLLKNIHNIYRLLLTLLYVFNCSLKIFRNVALLAAPFFLTKQKRELQMRLQQCILNQCFKILCVLVSYSATMLSSKQPIKKIRQNQTLFYHYDK